MTGSGEKSAPASYKPIPTVESVYGKVGEREPKWWTTWYRSELEGESVGMTYNRCAYHAIHGRPQRKMEVTETPDEVGNSYRVRSLSSICNVRKKSLPTS